MRTARLLILAGTDRLDKTLMIGQMQGKFQLEVVTDVGHMLHEVPSRLLLLSQIKTISCRRVYRMILSGWPTYLSNSGEEMIGLSRGLRKLEICRVKLVMIPFLYFFVYFTFRNSISVRTDCIFLSSALEMQLPKLNIPFQGMAR